MNLLTALLLLAAADAGDAPFPLSLRVGKTVDLCTTGTIQCPAVAHICDDTSIVAPESSSAGLLLKGMKPGNTLCSAASMGGAGPRRVYKVEVQP